MAPQSKSHPEEAPYKSTLVAEQGQLTKLIEAQGELNFHRELENFAHWLAAQPEGVRQKYRRYCEAWHLLRETGLTIMACVDPEWAESGDWQPVVDGEDI